MDYIYVAVGDYGFIKAVGKDGTALQFRGGGVVRVRTDGTGLEIVSRGQRNIYDVAIDPYMNLFTRDNTNDGDGWDVRLSHVVPTGHLRLSVAVQELRRRDRPAAGRLRRRLADGFALSPGARAARSLTAMHSTPASGAAKACSAIRSTAKGAGFTAGQEPFVKLPRPTDIDVDGNVADLHLLVARRDFTYVGPNVGYVIRVTHRGTKPPAFPNLKAMDDTQLVQELASDSQVLRLAAQREILRRGNNSGFAPSLEAIARSSSPLAPRVAAILHARTAARPGVH